MSILEDASQPAPVYASGSSGAAVGTARFSPPVSLLLAQVTVVYQGSTPPSMAVQDSGSHGWTLKTSKVNTGTAVYLYICYLSSAPGQIFVTAKDSAAHQCTVGLNLKVLDNANPVQTSAAVANTGADNVSAWGTITPTAQWSRLYMCCASDQVQYKDPAVTSYTLTEDFYQDAANTGTHLAGRWQTEAGASFSGEQLGWVLPVVSEWSWAATEILSADVGKSGSDTGTGGDGVAGYAKVSAQISGSSEAGTGSEPRNAGSGTGATTFVASSDSGTGNDTTPAASIPLKWINLGSTDAGTGNDSTAAGPALLRVADRDYGTSLDVSTVPSRVPGFSFFANLLVHEGFSLQRAAVLGGTGAEQAQLYGAQQITIQPNTSASDMQADDAEYGTWYSMTKAAVTVQGGFLPFATIALLGGMSAVSSGLSPADYYGLPLWTQYQHNKPAVPVAISMASRNANGAGPRTLTLVLYKVQLSVLDFTGTVYKSGLQVNYAGSALFSYADEQGNALNFPEVGRVISAAGSGGSAFGQQPFPGM